MGVLDDMTKGITERKAKAAGPKLTPVGLEASPTKPSVLPNDLPGRFMSSEDLGLAAASLREHAATLLATADAIDLLIDENAKRGPKADPKTAAADAQREQERAADERIRAKAAAEAKPELETIDVTDIIEPFTERLERLSAEAQAAAFASLDAAEPESPFNSLPREVPAAGWSCPDHGTANLKQLESRKGRRYMACQFAGCRQFEKE